MVASFPVEDGDQMMLVTNGGKIIEKSVADIRIAGRSTQGVTLSTLPTMKRLFRFAHLKETEENPKVKVWMSEKPTKMIVLWCG